jgi:hypothetical protein
MTSVIQHHQSNESCKQAFPYKTKHSSARFLSRLPISTHCNSELTYLLLFATNRLLTFCSMALNYVMRGALSKAGSRATPRFTAQLAFRTSFSTSRLETSRPILSTATVRRLPQKLSLFVYQHRHYAIDKKAEEAIGKRKLASDPEAVSLESSTSSVFSENTRGSGDPDMLAGVRHDIVCYILFIQLCANLFSRPL